MDIDGPMRTAGRLTHSCDATQVGISFGMSDESKVANNEEIERDQSTM